MLGRNQVHLTLQEQKLREVNRALYNDVHEQRDDAFHLRSQLLDLEKSCKAKATQQSAKYAQRVDSLRSEVEQLQEPDVPHTQWPDCTVGKRVSGGLFVLIC